MRSLPEEDNLALAQIVEEAVGGVLDKRWRVMVFTAAVVAAIVALAVSLPLTLLENSKTNHAAYARGVHNCQLVTSIADVLGAGNGTKQLPNGFISSDAKLRQEQALNAKEIEALHPGPLKSLLSDPQTARLSAKSSRQDANTTAYWTNVLIPALLSLAHVDCAAAASG